MKLLTAFCLGFSTLFYVLFPGQESVDVPSGFSLQGTPLQVETNAKKFNFKKYSIRPLADFKLKARVLSYKHYSSDKEAELSPVDLALGWGPMSKNEVLAKIDISQRNRWYFWRTDNFPIPRNEIESNSANMHIIPANDSVASILKNVVRGQVVSLEGHLVECTQEDWRWKSSLTRNDTGSGACEIIFVKEIEVSNP